MKRKKNASNLAKLLKDLTVTSRTLIQSKFCGDALDPGAGACWGTSPAPGSAVNGDAGRRASVISPALAAGTGARAKMGGTLSPRVHMALPRHVAHARHAQRGQMALEPGRPRDLSSTYILTITYLHTCICMHACVCVCVCVCVYVCVCVSYTCPAPHFAPHVLTGQLCSFYPLRRIVRGRRGSACVLGGWR